MRAWIQCSTLYYRAECTVGRSQIRGRDERMEVAACRPEHLVFLRQSGSTYFHYLPQNTAQSTLISISQPSGAQHHAFRDQNNSTIKLWSTEREGSTFRHLQKKQKKQGGWSRHNDVCQWLTLWWNFLFNLYHRRAAFLCSSLSGGGEGGTKHHNGLLSSHAGMITMILS